MRAITEAVAFFDDNRASERYGHDSTAQRSPSEENLSGGRGSVRCYALCIMRIFLRISLGLLLPSIAVLPVYAGDPPQKTGVAAVSAAHPKDSRGEVVYAETGTRDAATPAVAGTFVPAATLAEYKSPIGTHAQFNFGGLVEVEGVVTATGDVIDAQLLKGDPNSTLARKALATFSQAKFKPATLNGKPVAMLLRVKFRYSLFNSL